MPMDLLEPAEVEILRSINLDMDIADAHGQEVDPGGLGKLGRQGRVREGSARRSVPGEARGELADLGLDGDPVRVGKAGQRGDPPGVAVEGALRIGRHDQVEAAGDGLPDPVVRRAFVEDEAAGDRGRPGGRPAQRRVPAQAAPPASRSALLRKPPLNPMMIGERVCSAASMTPWSDSRFQLSK